jgi:hypothetical protein
VAPTKRKSMTSFLASILVGVGILGSLAGGVTILLVANGLFSDGGGPSASTLVTKTVTPIMWLLIGISMRRRSQAARKLVFLAIVWWVLQAAYVMAIIIPRLVAGTESGAVAPYVQSGVYRVLGLVPYVMLFWYLSTDKVRREFEIQPCSEPDVLGK